MNEVKKNLLKQLEPNETVIVATSGGPDSMALLHIVLSLREKINLNIICAHVNHKLRKESDEEEVMVKDFCTKNNISCEIMTIDDYKKSNIENQARNKRYEFFEKNVKKCQAKHLLTAHHGDDLIETILMRITRGSTLKGYQGFKEKIPKEGYTILRPLITVTKEQLLDYCEKNKIPYAIDKTNEEDKYTRNRYRKYILPKLKEEDKNVHKKFYKLSKTLELYNDYINEETLEKLKEIYINNKLNIEKFNNLKKLIKLKIIYHILEDAYKEDITLINDNHTKLILEMLKNQKPNQKIDLPNRIKAIKSYNYFYLEKEKEIEYYKKIIEPINLLPDGSKIIKQNTSSDHSNYTIYLDSKELTLPLYIRTYSTGDKIEVKGLNGSKKIKDIFINEKIPQSKRKIWPIVTDSENIILWIPGIKKSKFDKPKGENYDIILKYVSKEGAVK